MKVSIVTISFNQADFLEAALLSVLNQSYANVEYIVVDPGSTDGSRAIINRYREQIDHVIFKPDEGPADGLNRGFSSATGDVYGFLNSDDVLFEGALLEVVNAFEKNSSADVISGHGFIIDREGDQIRKIFSDRHSLLRDAFGQSILVQPSSFFLASAYKTVNGFNVENHSNWDGELFYNMAQHGCRFKTINKFWSGYRLYPESITGGAFLDSKIKAYGDRKFQEIMGRRRRIIDWPITMVLKIFKHISNPAALFERMRKGKIYGQG